MLGYVYVGVKNKLSVSEVLTIWMRPSDPQVVFGATKHQASSTEHQVAADRIETVAIP